MYVLFLNFFPQPSHSVPGPAGPFVAFLRFFFSQKRELPQLVHLSGLSSGCSCGFVFAATTSSLDRPSTCAWRSCLSVGPSSLPYRTLSHVCCPHLDPFLMKLIHFRGPAYVSPAYTIVPSSQRSATYLEA